MVHLDVQALLRSKTGQWIGQQRVRQPHAARLQMLQAVSGQDLKRDLRTVTICGVGADQAAVALAVRSSGPF